MLKIVIQVQDDGGKIVYVEEVQTGKHDVRIIKLYDIGRIEIVEAYGVLDIISLSLDEAVAILRKEG